MSEFGSLFADPDPCTTSHIYLAVLASSTPILPILESSLSSLGLSADEPIRSRHTLLSLLPTSDYSIEVTCTEAECDSLTSNLTASLAAAGLTVLTPPLAFPLPVPLLPPYTPPASLPAVTRAYAKYGFSTLPASLRPSPAAFACIKSGALAHAASVLSSVSRVLSLEPGNRVKFAEVMQRDKGRFDVDLSAAGIRVGGSPLGEFAARLAPWLPAVAAAIPGARLHRAGVVLSTGGGATGTQQWHADGPEAKPRGTALCCFLPLVDLDERTG
jgi:hypothetical protein